MGVIDAKNDVIAEEEIQVESSIRVKLFAKLIGQDVKSVQSALNWQTNADDPDTETEFKPFDTPETTDLQKMYDSVGLVRYACEKMARDIFQNGITIPGSEPKNEKLNQVPQSEQEEQKEKTQMEDGDSSARNKNILLDKQWVELSTPQNVDWGMRELLSRWVTLERKYGWAGIGKHPNGAFFVFSEDEYKENIKNYRKEGDTVKALRPYIFPCVFQMDHAKFTYTFKEDEVVLLVTRPSTDSWKGKALIMAIYAAIVYISNLEWGIAQSYWRFGTGEFVMYHPKGTNLKNQRVKFGTRRNSKTIHLAPLDHPNADPLNRIQNVGITTLHKMTEDLEKYYAIALAYLEIPETWYWGSGAGTNSTSYMNGIQYESTIQNERDDIYNGVLKGLNLIMGKEIKKFAWNAGQMMDELTKAEMLEGITFLTINEKRERFDEDLPLKPEWDEISDFSEREFEVESKPSDTTNTPKIE